MAESDVTKSRVPYAERQHDNFEARLANAVPEILKDPALLYRIKRDYLDHDIVGEDTSKLLLFVILATSLTDNSLGAIVTGESSAGKSHLVNKVAKHFNNVTEYTRITAASPDRSGQDFTNRILYVGELYGAERAQGTIRVLISEGKLRLWTTTTNEEGRLTTDCIETTGVPVFVSTTTTVRPDGELLNRLFLISVDESDDQTKRILEFEARKAMYTSRDDETDDTTPYLGGLLNGMVLEHLGHYKIPYADWLAKMFPITLRARRDFKKLLALIGSIAILHTYQRPIVYGAPSARPTKRYSVAFPIDLYLALRVCDKSLRETLRSMDDRTTRCLDIFKNTSSDVTISQAAERLNISQRRAGEILNELTNKDYLTKDESQKIHKYSLKHLEPESLIAIGDLRDFFSAYGETELKNFLTGQNLIALQRGFAFSKEAIDPLTGNPRDSDGMIADLSAGLKPRQRIIKKEQTTQDTKPKPEKLEDFKSETPTAAFPESTGKEYTPSIPPAVIVALRVELPHTFARLEILDAIQKLGYNPYASQLIFEDLEKDGVIYGTDIDREEYAWTR